MNSTQLPDGAASQPTRWAMLALAAFLLVCGVCAGALYVIVPFADPSATQLETNTVLGATAGFGFFFAAILAWQGLKNISAPPARVFPPALALGLAFCGAIFLGTAALAFKSAAPFVFPPFHFLAGLLIPLTFIAYAARRLGAQSETRALVASVSWGAIGATFLAVVAELVTAGLLILVVALALTSTADGRALLEQLRAQLQNARAGDMSSAFDALLSNPLTTTAALVYFAVIIPPIEEAVKTLALAFVNPQRTRMSDAVLWGIGAGAGFAALENLFNAAGLLSFWALGMLMRIGATTMHIATGAIMGRGWYAARIERRWSRLGMAYGASVLFHALWNGSVILLSQRASALALNPDTAMERLLAQGVLFFALTGVIAILNVLGMVWIVYAVRNAQKSLQPAIQ